MYKKKFISILFLTIMAFFPLISQASAQTDNRYRYPIYAGMTGGYGQTTWDSSSPPTRIVCY